MIGDRARRRDQLFDLLVDAPGGLFVTAIAKALACDLRTAARAIRDLRLFLADDELELTCLPTGPRKPHLYQLVASPAYSREWWSIRHKRQKSTLETDRALGQAEVNATDGRTLEGKRARIREMAARQLQEQLDLFSE